MNRFQPYADPIAEFHTAILYALGHAPDTIEPGKLQRFSTNGRPSDDAGWCKLFDDQRGGVFGCYRSGVSEKWSAVDRGAMTTAERVALARQVLAAQLEREQQRQQEWAKNADGINRISTSLVPLTHDDPVARYLRRRGIDAWPLPAVLRFHPALAYWEGPKKIGTFPAMVAPLVTPHGRTVALHRTYLTADGRKALVRKEKMVTRAMGPLAGACVPLHRPAAGCIGVAEGIETALAAWCASGIPTVAAYCAGNLKAWQWPAGVQHIVIFGDADEAGREAASKLRSRVLAAGLRCEQLTPTTEGADWCDVWAERGAVSIEAGGRV